MLRQKYLKKAIVFAVVVYGLLFGSVVYLLFFNSGLELVQVGSSKEGVVIAVKNSSSHIINDVNVFLEKPDGKQLLASATELLPDQNIAFSVLPSEAGGKLRVSASAPFHVGVSIEMTQKAAERSITYGINIQQTVFKEKAFEAEIELCNRSAGEETVAVEERHSKDFFPEEEQSQAISVKGKGCEKAKFGFEAKKEGKTEIYFNLKGQNLNESIKKEITVVAGK